MTPTTLPAPLLAQAQGGDILSFLPIILMFAILYFMMMRPQMKRQKELKAMLAALKKGDEVATIGGIVGTIVELDDNFATIAVGGSKTEVQFQRGAVQSVLPAGSLK